MSQRVEPGRLYGLTTEGEAVELPKGSVEPDVIVCRRLEDVPAHVLERTLKARPLAMGSCAKCGRPICWNASAQYGDQPKVCFQCEGMEPLPLE